MTVKMVHSKRLIEILFWLAALKEKFFLSMQIYIKIGLDVSIFLR